MKVTAVDVSYQAPCEPMEETLRLEAGVCSLACQMAIAGMYRAECLSAQRNAAMYGVSNEDIRGEALLTFLGDVIDVDKPASMTDQVFIARQLLHLDHTPPADAGMSAVEIVSEERVSVR